MPPQSVRFATIIILANALSGLSSHHWADLPLNAIHPTSAGESPLLSVMAGGFYVAISLPVLLVAALLYYKLRQGRNWARIVHSVFVALMMIPLISDFRLPILCTEVIGVSPI
jgi:hypothetical protein